MSESWLPITNRALDEGTYTQEEFVALHAESRLQRAEIGEKPVQCRPIVTPIYQSAIYLTDSLNHYKAMMRDGGYVYQRLGDPTAESAELLVNQLEGGCGTLLFSSGMAALSTVALAVCGTGDHMVLQKPVYSGMTALAVQTLSRFGVEVSYIRPGQGEEEFRKVIRHNTKLVHIETPCNPTMAVTDVAAVARACSGKCLLSVDGTFGSPYLQQVLALGADISAHSCRGHFSATSSFSSKYMNGHSDVVAGCVTVKDLSLGNKLRAFQELAGNQLSPMDSFLLARGLKTLALRMEKHSSNALTLAQYLENHPKVVKVNYSGLETSQDHGVARLQMKASGGMISFDVGTANEAAKLVESVRLIRLGVSLGGTHSLIEHPASMTHAASLYHNKEEVTQDEIPQGLIRFSVGTENAADLLKDLEQALATL